MFPRINWSTDSFALMQKDLDNFANAFDNFNLWPRDSHTSFTLTTYRKTVNSSPSPTMSSTKDHDVVTFHLDYYFPSNSVNVSVNGRKVIVEAKYREGASVHEYKADYTMSRACDMNNLEATLNGKQLIVKVKKFPPVTIPVTYVDQPTGSKEPAPRASTEAVNQTATPLPKQN